MKASQLYYILNAGRTLRTIAFQERGLEEPLQLENPCNLISHLVRTRENFVHDIVK